MPTGNRFRAKVGDRRCDVSATQHRLLLLTQRDHNITHIWILAKGYDRQAAGLVAQGLWRKVRDSYLLTKRGEAFLDLVRARTQPQTRKVTNG